MLRIGIDLGGTNIAVGLVNEENQIIAKAWTPTRPEIGPEGIADDMANCIQNALLMAGADLCDCAGIGLGSPGTCDAANGAVRNAHNLGWSGVPICAMLTERTGLPAALDNDANCAALGEVLAGAARGCSSALMITLGTGVGGGLVIDGKIFSGFGSLGGEFGHTCIAMDGEACTCGQRGCWEAYASATALIRQGTAAALENPASALARLGELDGEKIFRAAREGDETAGAVVARYCEYVGVGLTNLINCVYPEAVILGGGVSAAGEQLLGPVRAYIESHFFVGDRPLAPKLVRAVLGNDAGIIGAAALC
ncbi:MAG: ROK family protein [Oscillospiraceae bacterium]